MCFDKLMPFLSVHSQGFPGKMPPEALGCTTEIGFGYKHVAEVELRAAMHRENDRPASSWPFATSGASVSEFERPTGTSAASADQRNTASV